MSRVARLSTTVVSSALLSVALSATALAVPSGDDPDTDPNTDTETPNDEPAPEPQPDPASEEPTADRGGDIDVETAPKLLFPRPTWIGTAAKISETPFNPVTSPNPAETDSLSQAKRVSVAPDPEFAAVAPASSPFDAVITEILYNPSAVYDSRGEFFEIHNPSSATIDLAGWTFGDEVYDKHTISALTIEPGDHAVLARFGEFARNGGVEADYVYGDSVLLFNVGDQVVVRDADGLVVDVVDYSLDSFPDPVGKSISLDDAASDNADGANWCVSSTPLVNGDHASPGSATMCRESAASFVITEIMNNPARTSDFTGEWFEVLNTGNETVDLDGFGVKDDDGDFFTVNESVPVAPGDYAVFAVSDDVSVNGDITPDVIYGDSMRLHNSFDELVLVDWLGIEVDAVRWDDGRTFPDPNGASMRLDDASADNSNGENWCESAQRWSDGDFGSPGATGSCTPTDYAEVVITEVMFDPERVSPERQGEWFELANTGTETAVLDGYTLRTYSTQHTIESLSIPGGERAVLAVNGDSTENGGVDADYVFGSDLPLYNTTSTLEVVAPDSTLIDRVRWTASLGFPNDKGHSMELRVASANNVLGANWCSTTDRYGDGDFGTPGTAGTCEEPAAAPALMISEVMRNPAVVSDTKGEWIEIHNPTADAVDLRNWSIGDENSEFHVITDSVVIEPNGYAVIARNADESENGGVAADYEIGFGMVLINSGDKVVLSDRYGQFVDGFKWDNSDLMPRPNGGSVARTMSSMRSLAPSDDPSGWCVTSEQFGMGDRGTPGAQNDCVIAPNHAIVINEIHRNPAALPDAQGEWIELHNAGAVDIDISGWTLRDDDVDTYVFDSDNPVIVPAGGFLVAGRNTEELNGGIDIDVQYGVEFIHFNTADEVMLLDADLAVIDRVAWTATNGFPKVAGATMSLRSAELNNAVGTNWCAAVTDQGNGDFGTPGEPNLCEIPDPEPEPDPVDFSYSLFATGDAACRGEVKINSSDLTVGTKIRTNDDIAINGSAMTVFGQVSHADKAQIGHGAKLYGGIVQEPGTQTDPLGWQLADFAPGGAQAVAAGDDYTFHTGTWRVNGDEADIDPGLHYVDGDVQISTGNTLLNGVSIVATGQIKINSTEISLVPYASNMPTLFAGETKCNQDGIKLGASLINVTGALYSPTSHIKINTSLLTATDSSLVGNSIHMGGSRILINVPPVVEPDAEAYVRVTAICRGTGAENGLAKFRVRHEQDSNGPFEYNLQVGGNVLYSGRIEAADVQYVWLPSWAAGVKVIPTNGWSNLYGGTASTPRTVICN